MQFTVGLKHNGKTYHVTADGDDALVVALKVKNEHPDSLIMYVRPINRRGDARHPALSSSQAVGAPPSAAVPGDL